MNMLRKLALHLKHWLSYEYAFDRLLPRIRIYAASDSIDEYCIERDLSPDINNFAKRFDMIEFRYRHTKLFDALCTDKIQSSLLMLITPIALIWHMLILSICDDFIITLVSSSLVCLSLGFIAIAAFIACMDVKFAVKVSMFFNVNSMLR